MESTGREGWIRLDVRRIVEDGTTVALPAVANGLRIYVVEFGRRPRGRNGEVE